MKILISAGGSGGHIFPAASLMQELKKDKIHADFIFAISSREEEKRLLGYLKEKGFIFRLKIVPLKPLRGRNVLNLASFAAGLLIASAVSFLFMATERPRIVIGFGGYLSGPLVLSAFVLRIPMLIHEQNIFPGRANRILSRFVQRIALSFDESRRYFRQARKITVTGNPLRGDIRFIGKEAATEALNLNPGIFTVLVLGGSQGAASINKNFTEALEIIKEEKLHWQFIHITGLKDSAWVSTAYKKLGMAGRVFDLFKDMSVVYGASDLVITRAGAATLNELSYLGKAAIAIPYPYAGGHQALNAEYYSERGALLVIREKDLTPAALFDSIDAIARDSSRRESLCKKNKHLNRPDAAGLLAKEVRSLVYAN